MLNLLTVTWDVNPFILTIGDFSIRWYSLFFVAGIFPIGYWIMRSFYRREGLPTETLEPLLIALFIGTIVGARLGHCLFYDPEVVVRAQIRQEIRLRIYPDHRPPRYSRLFRRHDDTPGQPHEL